MANQISNVGFSDYSAEQADIERRRAMAQALQQQGQTPMGPTEHVGGWAIKKSPFEGLAKMLQSYTGAKGQEDATAQQKALGQKYQSDLASTLMKAQAAGTGTPGSPSPADALGGGPAQPAVPGDRQEMARILMGHPGTQAIGQQQMLAGLAPPTRVDLGDRIALVNAQQQIVGYLPKGATPDASMRDTTTRAKNDVAPSGVVYNPYQTKPGEVFNDPNKLMNLGAGGSPVLNQPLFQAKKEIAAKGAANVQVKTDVKTGESLAGQVGPMMKDSVAIAEGAVKQIDAAKRIVQAVDAGKIITGPTADVRMVAAQIGQALGVGGANDAEKILNTRQALRGLAELTLQGRQQMKGQGAITESEGKLAEKAMSGEITFTAAEIKQLAQASERAANFNLTEHRRKLKVMNENPNLQGIAPFYQGPAVPPTPGAAPPVQLSPATRDFLKQQGIQVD